MFSFLNCFFFIQTNLLCYSASKNIMLPLQNMFPHNHSFVSQLFFVTAAFMTAAYFQVLPTCTVTKRKVVAVTVGTGYN